MLKPLLILPLLTLSACALLGPPAGPPTSAADIRTYKISDTEAEANNTGSYQLFSWGQQPQLGGQIQKRYQTLGQVSGIACQKDTSANKPRESAAMDDLRDTAFQLQANAVLAVQCQVDSILATANNCLHAIDCSGMAIKYIE